jgi:LacI family transcriptional regulator
VPQDISVVGFDDTESMPDGRGRNMLTTVQVPLVELGQRAAELLLRHIKGNVPEVEEVVIPTTLVIRGSTAPPPKRRRGKAAG